MKINVQMSPVSEAEQPVQVWLVDDNNRLRSLIAESLERGGSVHCARQFDSPNGLLSTLASRSGPDVILLDVQMGELNGLDALPAIKSLARETRVFMLTTFFDPAWHRQAMESGASGYYLKGDSMDKLLASIHDRSNGAVTKRRRRRPTCQPVGSLHQRSPVTASTLDGHGSRSGLFGWLKRFASS